jgi:hypothetical protein
MRPILYRLYIGFMLLIPVLSLAAAVSVLLFPAPPTESSLKVVTGTLAHVNVVPYRDAQEITFDVIPANATRVSLHIKAASSNKIAAAQDQTVTVKYKDALLGNPAYELRTATGPLVTYAETVALDGHTNVGKRTAMCGILILYGALPLMLFALVHFLKRRSASSQTIAFTVGAVIYSVTVGFLLHDVWTDADMLKPFVGVFGKTPFGLRAEITASASVLLMLAPLATMGWHVLHLLMIWRGQWKSTAADFRRHTWLALASLAMFVLLCGAWICATAKARV